jgi:hypothetical protein
MVYYVFHDGCHKMHSIDYIFYYGHTIHFMMAVTKCIVYTLHFKMAVAKCIVYTIHFMTAVAKYLVNTVHFMIAIAKRIVYHADLSS